MSRTQADPIVVVGAGWAGLACALTLARQGKKVTVLEAAPQAGGRARSIPFGTSTVDNGQHALLGAYHHTLTISKWLNIPENVILNRLPLDFCTIDPQKPHQTLGITLPQLPFPLQFFAGLLKAKGISIREKLKISQFSYELYQNDFQLKEDISVKTLLSHAKQSDTMINQFWGPLALAALSTPIEIASAQVFLHVLKDAFTHQSGNSDWLLPKVDLSQMLPQPLIQYLNKQQCSVLYHHRVRTLMIENGQCIGVSTQYRDFRAEAVILATPPHTTAELLGSQKNLRSFDKLIADLSRFHYQPITTIYLKYPKPINLPKPLIGLINSLGQWIFDRKTSGQPDILSVIITSQGRHSTLNHATLITELSQELSQLFPTLQEKPLEARVICEKRAAFSCEVGISAFRPPNNTPFANLLLAGDYTQTHYPATLEGALQSGIKAAELLLLTYA